MQLEFSGLNIRRGNIRIAHASILVVETDSDRCAALSRLLTDNDYRVYTAESRTILNQLRHALPDVAILSTSQLSQETIELLR